jgi:hypothetical protein
MAMTPTIAKTKNTVIKDFFMITSILPDNVEFGYRNSLCLFDSENKPVFRQFEQRIACHPEDERGESAKAQPNRGLGGLQGIGRG